MKDKNNDNGKEINYLTLDNNHNKININSSSNLRVNYSINKDKNELKEICPIHQNNIIEYCITCNKFLCFNCKNSHLNHSIITQKEIQFDNDEIINIQKSIKKYIETYNKLNMEIKLWKKNIEKKLYKLDYFINKNEIINIKEKALNDNFFKYLPFNEVIKYRKIFCLINNKSSAISKNVKILSLFSPFYDEILINENIFYNKYSLSKLLLKELTRKDDFILKSIEIIKYLNELYNNDSNNFNNLNSNKIIDINKNSKLNTSQINGSSIFSSNNINTKQLYVNYNIFPNNTEDDFLNKSENNIHDFESNHIMSKYLFSSKSNDKYKLTEKYIRLKPLSCEHKQKIIEETEIKFDKKIEKNYNLSCINNNYDNNNNNDKKDKFKQILNNIYISDINENKTKNGNNQIKYNKNIVYSKKNLNYNSSKNINFMNNTLQINKTLSLDNDINKKKIFLRSNSFKNRKINGFDKNKLNLNNIEETNSRTISSVILSTESTKKNINKSCKDIQISKFTTDNKSTKTIYINRRNYRKKYIHKKFLPVNNTLNILNEQSINEQNLNINNDKNVIQNDADNENKGILFNKIFDDTQKKEESNNNTNNKTINYNKRSFIIQSKKQGINISKKNYQRVSKKTPIKMNKINSIKNNMQNKELNINIKKSDKNEKYYINSQKEIHIGLELNNTECKIALINLNNNNELNSNKKIDIDLISFNENKISVPSMISFDQNNNCIKIGDQAYSIFEDNPSQTIFNIVKLIGANYDDINEKKKYWPFKLYKSEQKNKLYLKIDFNGEKEKIFFIEDLLIIFLKKLFKLFFNKIIINENNINSNREILMNLVVTVPNYFNYTQRKIIENIFKTNIFPNHKGINSVSNYNLIMKKFKIENSSSIAALCYNNNLNQNPKNLLIINFDGCSINLSIVSIIEGRNKIYEVKNISGKKYGIEDFIDKFMYDCLSELEFNSKQDCINSPYALAKLRKSCKDAIASFKENSSTEINISKLYGTIELKLIMDKNNFKNSCKEIYDEIIESIKNIILESNLNENDIDDIVLIGEKYSIFELNQIIEEVFKDNLKIKYNLGNNNYENYLVSGAALQAYNISNTLPKFNFIDVAPNSFGVETINEQVDIIIEKGSRIPATVQKYVKIKNDCNENNIYINIYEGENAMVKDNNLITSCFISKDNFINEKKIDIYDILILFELDIYLNLNVFIIDQNTNKKKFECIIDSNYLKQ